MDDPSGGLEAPQLWRPPIGGVLNERYRLLALIGEGALGTVYRAERLGIDRPVAVKFLQAEVARDPNFVQRFQIEARALARLSHPNCISVLDFGVERLPYLVMDFVEGVSLRRLIDDRPLEPRRAVGIASQLLAGLAHAHSKGVIHRDIKPENIVIERGTGLDGDHVRILDFGMAKLLDGGSMLTMGMFLGTPNYMAPEQLGEGELDERADQYAAGIILYEMLTGRKPFDRPSIPEILLAQKETPAPPFRAIAPEVRVSATLEAVVRRALKKSPTARFPSALAMREVLEALTELVPAEPAPPIESAPRAASDATLFEPQPWGALESEEASSSRAHKPVFTRRQTAETWGHRAQRWLAVAARLWMTIKARMASSLGAGARHAMEVVSSGQARWKTLSLRARRIAGIASALVLGSTVWAVAASFPTGRTNGTPDREAPTTADTDPRPVAGLAGSEPAANQRRLASAAGSDGPAPWRQQAASLQALTRQHPADARHPAALARLLFEHRRYAQGLASFRVAIRRDRSVRQDPVLVGHVIDGLAFERFAPAAEDFLRNSGKDARTQVREAARNHKSPRVRARARRLLQNWTRRPFLQWGR